MKTTAQAKEQAFKILTYNMTLSNKLRAEAEKINRKPYSKNTALRLKRYEQVRDLNNKADMYENRGQKAWGMFTNNPNYYGWLTQTSN